MGTKATINRRPATPRSRPSEEIDQIENDLASIFESNLGPPPEPRSRDEWTIADLAHDRGISISRANAIARELLGAGKVTRRHISANKFMYRFTRA